MKSNVESAEEEAAQIYVRKMHGSDKVSTQEGTSSCC